MYFLDSMRQLTLLVHHRAVVNICVLVLLSWFCRRLRRVYGSYSSEGFRQFSKIIHTRHF